MLVKIWDCIHCEQGERPLQPTPGLLVTDVGNAMDVGKQMLVKTAMLKIHLKMELEYLRFWIYKRHQHVNKDVVT